MVCFFSIQALQMDFQEINHKETDQRGDAFLRTEENVCKILTDISKHGDQHRQPDKGKEPLTGVVNQSGQVMSDGEQIDAVIISDSDLDEDAKTENPARSGESIEKVIHEQTVSCSVFCMPVGSEMASQ